MKKNHLSASSSYKHRQFQNIIMVLGLFFLVGIITVYYQAKLLPSTHCANSISCITDLSGKPDATSTGIFDGKVVQAPPVVDELAQTTSKVLGDSDAQDDWKHIYVDLTHQQLTAYEGKRLVYAFPISSGKWGITPTGTFRIWIKLRATRMTGGDKAKGDFYDLPNVPYTMYFYNDQVPKSEGYGLHAAYWHNNFGHPMSHGCVNLSIDAAHKLYDWVNPATTGFTTYTSENNLGTLITITGVTPNE